jgi:hypothetical protein
MHKMVDFAPVALLFVTTAHTPALAQASVFDSLPYTDMKTLEAVDASGSSTYSGTFPLKMLGIVLNNPADMADSSPNSAQLQPFNPNPYWQIFVQTVDVNRDDDFGGVALYMAQNYGNIPPALTFPGGIPTPDPTASYTDQQWQSQVDRLNTYAQNSPPAPHQLQAGDLVEIRARGGLFFGGKFNVNEEHIATSDYASDPGLSFDVIYLGHPGLPAPVHLTLADIWDNVANAVTFDPTRATGGEHFQGTLVRLDDVRLSAGQAASWLPNGQVIVEDHEGRTFPLQLGTNPLFTPATAPSGWFDVQGIFDQEAPSSGPFTGSYEVWVMDPADVAVVPEPTSSALALIALALVSVHRLWRRWRNHQ